MIIWLRSHDERGSWRHAAVDRRDRDFLSTWRTVCGKDIHTVFSDGRLTPYARSGGLHFETCRKCYRDAPYADVLATLKAQS